MIAPVRALAKRVLLELPVVSDSFVRWRIRKQFESGRARGFMPRQLAIEPVSYCQADCVMCPYSSMTRPKGIMSATVHRAIVDRVREWGAPISSITHAGLGEPLIDKGLADKVRFEKAAFPAAEVTVFTNAGLLDGRRGRELLDAGLDRLSISLNAIRKETYEAVMKIPFEPTMRNLEGFLELNRAAGHPVELHVSLIPTEHHTREEIEAFREHWTGKADAVVIPPWISWGGFLTHSQNETRWPCRYIWEVLQVDWDGTVKMCCEDFNTEFPLGNLSNETPGEVFNSDRLRQQRAAQVDGDFQAPRICKDCVETHRVAREFWKTARLARVR